MRDTYNPFIPLRQGRTIGETLGPKMEEQIPHPFVQKDKLCASTKSSLADKAKKPSFYAEILHSSLFLAL